MKKMILLALCLIALLLAFHIPVAANGYDVNGDGRITVKDATCVQQHIAEFGAEATNYIEISDVASYKQTEEKFLHYLITDELHEGEGFMVIDSHELTAEIITNRTNHNVLLVERVIGVATSDNGDGRVLNTNGDFNYISYRGIHEPYCVGTIIATYLIYNPDNNESDDIVSRYDYVIDRSFEED